MRYLRIIISIAIVSVLTLSSACTVSMGGEALGENGIGIEGGDGANPFITEGGDEDDPATGDAGGEDGGGTTVVVESDDDVDLIPHDPEAMDPLEITTVIDGSYTHAVVGDGNEYQADFMVLDQGGYYEWSIEGLPQNTGLLFEELGGSQKKRSWLHGFPTSDDLGTHHITVTVRDANDASNSASIEYDLTVEDEPTAQEFMMFEDVCQYPMKVVVEEMHGFKDATTSEYTDPDILNKGEGSFLIGSHVKIKVRAVRMKGEEELKPKGTVKWSWTSEVEGSEHYRCMNSNDPGNGDPNMWGSYDWEWFIDEDILPSCIFNERRVTTNPTWDSPGLHSSFFKTLTLKGMMLYDGPLPVKGMKKKEHPIERLLIEAKDECEADPLEEGFVGPPEMLGGVKVLKLGARYPGAGDPGGDLDDIKVNMDYEGVGHVWSSSSGGFESGGCAEGEFQYLCEMGSKLVLLFTGSSGLKSEELDPFLNSCAWDVIPAVEKSFGYVAYDIKECDEDKANCGVKTVRKVGGRQSSVLNAMKVYLLWQSPEIIVDKGASKKLDFDINYISLGNRYYCADYSDIHDDVFNNNLMDFVRYDILTSLDGMSSPNPDGGVFRRKELAAFIEKWTSPPGNQ